MEKIRDGGAPLKDSLKNTLVKSSCDFYETYGMTETASHVALKNIKSSSDNCFEALENIKFSVDRRNCLVVDAPKLYDKQLVTNDVVDLIDDGHFRWLGRLVRNSVV